MNNSVIPVYIGYDPVESGAFYTCADSIQRNSSQPVAIIPVNKRQLPLTRPWDLKQSNEFAFTRFLTPWLAGYEGHAIFMDCDFLFFEDISYLWDLRDSKYAVQVCKHKGDTFKAGRKYLGTEQTVYNKKCWSSLMIFNCEHPDTRKLTPEYVNEAHGLHLHQFQWTKEKNIGSIPLEWNWLVGHYGLGRDICALHYTEGGPYFKDYRDTDFAEDWWDAFYDMIHVKDGISLERDKE